MVWPIKWIKKFIKPHFLSTVLHFSYCRRCYSDPSSKSRIVLLAQNYPGKDGSLWVSDIFPWGYSPPAATEQVHAQFRSWPWHVGICLNLLHILYLSRFGRGGQGGAHVKPYLKFPQPPWVRDGCWAKIRFYIYISIYIFFATEAKCSHVVTQPWWDIQVGWIPASFCLWLGQVIF